MNNTKSFFDNFTESNIKPYRPFPFWSWNNKLDKAELINQIHEMHKTGIGGFIMHARSGLITEYLGDYWFDCVDACLKEAKKLNMDAWVYDENGWPSGMVGGKLLENIEYRAQYLKYEVKEYFDDSAVAVFDLQNGLAKRVYQENGLPKYHCIYLRTSPSNTDILNPVVVDAFINETYQVYYDRFAESFGNELVGFFTDEPQYYRWGTPYTKVLENDYFQRFKENIHDGLLYLFIKSDQGNLFRYRYYSMLNEYYTNHFYKKIFDWCENHNCMLTGHSVEETSLFGQMWCCAGAMTSYEYEHIPGIDHLARVNSKELVAKQVTSVSEQLGFKKTMTETFGCSGYDITPAELKSIGESQFFHGVNYLCLHLMPYSIASQAKYDHPPVFSKHNNWWDVSKVFNDYFAKLGYIISQTSETVDVAVIHPIKSAYFDYIRKDDYESIRELEDAFENFLLKLRNNCILYHLVDETILQKHGKVENGGLTVGDASYKTVLTPFIKVIQQSTYSLLNDFSKDGGRLLMENTPLYIDGKMCEVDLRSNINFEDVLNARTIKPESLGEHLVVTARKGDMGEFVFIKNVSENSSSSFKSRFFSDEYLQVDLTLNTLHSIESTVNLDANGSLILIKKPNNSIDTWTTETLINSEDVTEQLKVNSISENYLMLDNICYSTDGQNYSDKLYIQQAAEQLLRQKYIGPLWIKYEFTTQFLPETMTLMFENCTKADVFVNDMLIKSHQSKFDHLFAESDISPFLKQGDNTICFKIDYYQDDNVHFALFDPDATESLRNMLAYNTEIENIYLRGKFVVDDNFILSPLPKDIPVCDDLDTKGFPFFYGSVYYDLNVNYLGGHTKMKINGNFSSATLTSNLGSVDFVLGNEADISKCLTKGNNHLQLELRSSLRNFMGPHHYKHDQEPKAVSPYTFTFRGSWENGESPDFTPQYHTQKFGIRSVLLYKWIYAQQN